MDPHQETADQSWDVCVGQAKNGDQDALSKMLFSIASDLRIFSRKLIHPQWSSILSEDDLMQETYIEVFSDIQSFQGQSISQFKGWLKKICRNNYIDAERSLLTQKRGGKLNVAHPSDNKDESMMELYGAVCSEDSPSFSASKQEAIQRLTHAVQNLPARYADVILAIDIQNESVATFADRENCSEGAVYMRRTRAIRELRKQFGSSMDF